MNYEFSETDTNLIARVSNKFLIASILLLLGGFFGIVIAFIHRNEVDSWIFILWNLEALTQIGAAYYLLKPMNNFKRLATIQGHDIEELMNGIKTMSKSFFMIFLILVLVIIFTLLHFIL